MYISFFRLKVCSHIVYLSTSAPTPNPTPPSGTPNPTQPTSSSRRTEWLDAHNTRRQSWHERYGRSFVPLRWSTALEEESKVYANKLLEQSCQSLEHGKQCLFLDNGIHSHALTLTCHCALKCTGQTPITSTVKTWLASVALASLPNSCLLTRYWQGGWRTKKMIHTRKMGTWHRYCGDPLKMLAVVKPQNLLVVVGCVTFRSAAMLVQVEVLYLHTKCISSVCISSYPQCLLSISR